MDLDADFRPGKITPFPPTAFNDLDKEEGRASINPIVLDEEEDKGNSPLTTPVTERPIEPPMLHTGCRFGKRFENVLEIAYRTLFE